MHPERLEQLYGFLALADRLKHVPRRGQTVQPDGTLRAENSAEHCWNAALVALLLHGEDPEAPDLATVLAMIVAHDLVEIEAGDTFAFDEAGQLTQAARELAAADVVFGALPADLGRQLRGLWEEFEAGETPAARFAMACDRAQGFLQGVLSGGHWYQVGVTEAISRRRMDPASAVAPPFRAMIEDLYRRAREAEMFAP